MPESPAAWQAPPFTAGSAGHSLQTPSSATRRAWLSGLGIACSLPPLWALWQRWTLARPARIGDGIPSDLAVPAAVPAGTATDAAVVSTQALSAAAWAPIRIACALDLGAPQRISLPHTFNRSLLLCTDWAEGPGGWVGGALDAQETRTGYGLSYVWWTGVQRFATLELPAPGYLRSLHDGRRDAGVPVADFLRRRLGFRRDRLKADDPAPFAFHEADFQAIPARLDLRVERAALAGLMIGDPVSLSLGRPGAASGSPAATTDIPPPAGSDAGIRARVAAISPAAAPSSEAAPAQASADPSGAGPARDAVTVGIALNDSARRQLARLALEHETASDTTRPRPPRWLTMSLAGTGTAGAATPGFVWLPRGAVRREPGRTERDAPLGRVWTVVDGHAVPVQVLIGGRTDSHLGVQEAPSAGLPLAVDPDVWTSWSRDTRARLLRSALAAAATGAPGDATHPGPAPTGSARLPTLPLLRPGSRLIIEARADLRPGQAVRIRTQEPG